MSLNLICLNGSSFSIIDEKSQTLKWCFTQSLILVPSYLVFAIVNGYMIGFSHDLSRNYKNATISLLRWCTTLLMTIICVDLFCRYFIQIPGNDIYLSENSCHLISFMITDIYKCLAFFLHSIYIFNKNILCYFSKRHLFSFLFVFFANMINLINEFFLQPSGSNDNHNDYQKFDFILLCFYNFLLLIYVIIASCSYKNLTDFNFKNNTDNNRLNNINGDQTAFESFNNINKRIKFQDDEENECYVLNLKGNTFNKYEPEEDSASYFSYITFSWLQPLLTKGYKRQIESIQQLVRLPFDLNLTQVCDRFMSKYMPNKSDDLTYDENKNNPILNPELLLNSEYIERNTQVYEEDKIFQMNLQHKNISRNKLISALLKCFGRKFFLLGVFKFLNDSLNFAGPILLNQLVLFVETNQSSLKDGSTYAALLFVCTLLGSLINIHFTNALNKLCLRIRSALISCIYRKAVLVKLNELNKHSIGQIVNYMSIDSGSITNAFPSFHQFWSLPFQISITLYLLYSQIGLSFLVGVGFVIILIPINKVISDYIGKVQKRLMQYKDERVKVIQTYLYL